MNQWLLLLPVLAPLVTAALGFALRARHTVITRLSWAGSGVSLVAAILLTRQVVTGGPTALAFAGWQAPFGIVFVADLFSAFMVLITTIIGLCVVVYAAQDLSRKRSYGLYHVLVQVLLAGVGGAFLTGDIFNLYVWFEVMLIASFGLMILDTGRRRIGSAVKYVVLNLVSTLAFLMGAGLLYGATGTLNLADLHAKAAAVPPETAALLAGLFLFGFGVKSALFPVFAWLPEAYPTLPGTVAALFAALLTKVGVYALVRMFTLVFPLDAIGWQPLLIWVAGLTMLTGVLGAAAQFSIRKILSFHIVSQTGYMVMGLALYTEAALTGTIFYLIHHIIVKTNLFFVGGVLAKRHGGDHLQALGGTCRTAPFLAFLFVIPAFSLAGFPPLSGFWGKFLVIRASLAEDHFGLAATALLVGLLTLYSMTKIWSEAFWKASPEAHPPGDSDRNEKTLYLLPIALLALLTVCIGLAVEPLFQLAGRAARELLNPQDYIRAVLGGGI